MIEIYYKFDPVFLAFIGCAMGFWIYFLHDYIFRNFEGAFWAVLIAVLTLTGFTCGKLIKKLNERSTVDSLTGLHNRRYFYDRLLLDMERIKRSKLPLSIAVIDVDNFKKINDKYGHIEGDRVLTELAQIFKANVRANDTVVRWGGEEFIIILPDIGIDGAKAFAERIRSVVESYNFNFEVTICVGLTCTMKVTDIHEFVALADQALYKAKEKKNSVVSMENSVFVEVAG